MFSSLKICTWFTAVSFGMLAADDEAALVVGALGRGACDCFPVTLNCCCLNRFLGLTRAVVSPRNQCKC